VRAEIARTRQRGYAFNPGLLQPGSWGVGVAVLDRAGHCAGALSIAAIESRLGPPRCDQMAALLQAEAQRLSECLAHPAPHREPAKRGHRS
jgi:DNA-binding IclR family transcriptional regulator